MAHKKFDTDIAAVRENGTVHLSPRAIKWIIGLLLATTAAGTGGMDLVFLAGKYFMSVGGHEQQTQTTSSNIDEVVKPIAQNLKKLTEKHEQHIMGVHTATSKQLGEAVHTQNVIQAQVDDVQTTVSGLSTKVERLTKVTEDAIEENTERILANVEELQDVYNKTLQIEGQVNLLVRELIEKPRLESRGGGE